MKPLFLTFYDKAAIALRTFQGICDQEGIDSHIISLKNFESDYGWKRIYPLAYQSWRNGMRQTYMSDPVTDTEIELCLDKIAEWGIDHLLISTQSYGLPVAERFVASFRKRFDMPVIAGGWGPTLEPEKTLQWADYVIFGEGEKPLIDILKGEHLSKVNNAVYWVRNGLVRNPVYELMTPAELSELPYQAYHDAYLVDKNRIIQRYENGPNYIRIFCGRGCPNHCAYCLAWQRGEIYRGIYSLKRYPKYRLMDVDRILDEIIHVKKTYNLQRVSFTDEIFPWNKKWLETFCKRYPVEVGLPFHSVVIPELHGYDWMQKLIDVGLDYTSVAFQTASPRVLKMYTRGKLSAEGAKKFAEFLEEKHIPFDYKLIAHNPLETESDIKTTLNWLWNAPMTPHVLVFQLNQFPGSKLTQIINEQNPDGMPEAVVNWYCFLYCLAAMGNLRRTASKIIYKLKLFKNHPDVLAQVYKKLFLSYKKIRRMI